MSEIDRSDIGQCIYCGAPTLGVSVVCIECARKGKDPPSPSSQNPFNPSTVNFTKPVNPREGKDPSVKQALELEQRSYTGNIQYFQAHPELVKPHLIAGSKSGDEVLRDREIYLMIERLLFESKDKS